MHLVFGPRLVGRDGRRRALRLGFVAVVRWPSVRRYRTPEERLLCRMRRAGYALALMGLLAIVAAFTVARP